MNKITTGFGVIRRVFFKAKGDKPLSDKAFEKGVPAMKKYFEADEIVSACYIGDGVYNIVCWNSLETEVDPQGAENAL